MSAGRVYSYTKGLCHSCRKIVDARYQEHQGKVYLDKFCPEHGTSRALVCSDASWYENSMKYVKPGQAPFKRAVEDFCGCPDSCGLCPQHMQHTCLPVIEITNGCDLSCPVCLKDLDNPINMSADDFSRLLDRLMETEGQVPIINLSGGEPTSHPQIERFLEIAAESRVVQSSVSTNGMRLLRDKKLRDVFKETGTVVSLQFDGFRRETYEVLRGRDLSREKLDLIKFMESEGMKYSLVSTIAPDVNDDELDDIIDLFFNSKALSITIQPASYTGSAAIAFDSEKRVTTPDVLKGICKSKYVNYEDFNPLPCSHYSCFTLSYYFEVGDGTFASFKELFGHDNYIDIIANKAVPGMDRNGALKIRDRIYELWSAGDVYASNDDMLGKMRRFFDEMNSSSFSSRRMMDMGVSTVKSVFIHQFMDMHTMDLARLMKCCTHYPQVDGRLIPMCAQNVFNQ